MKALARLTSDRSGSRPRRGEVRCADRRHRVGGAASVRGRSREAESHPTDCQARAEGIRPTITPDGPMKLALLAAGVIGAAALVWWLHKNATAADRLIAEAVRGKITGFEAGLKENQHALKQEASVMLDRLGTEDHAARVGLVRLLGGVRYHQLSALHGSSLQSHLNRSLTPPDEELTDVLVKIYLTEVEFGKTLDEDTSYERLAGISHRVAATDFLTQLEFTRRCWETAPDDAKLPLSHNLSVLLSIATTPPDEADNETSGWYGISIAERQHRQSAMMQALREWAIPTLVSAANGRNVPGADVGHYQYLARSYQIDFDAPPVPIR